MLLCSFHASLKHSCEQNLVGLSLSSIQVGQDCFAGWPHCWQESTAVPEEALTVEEAAADAGVDDVPAALAVEASALIVMVVARWCVSVCDGERLLPALASLPY